MGIITSDYNWFNREEESLTQEDLEFMGKTIGVHEYKNGRGGVIMAMRVGKAMKASIANPLKIKTGLVQRFKNKVKEWLA
jgi:hypothetical protein